MKRIGLFGGTFDPVHTGHVQIASSFIESGFIDELWILLTPFPPHKLGEKHVPYSKRLSMLHAAFSETDFKILSIEQELPKPSYTYRTIQVLKEMNPDSVFYFCLGEDSLSQFHTWKHFEEILDESHLLVAKRPHSNHRNVNNKILNSTTFVEHTPVEVSSSAIRNRISDKEFLKANIPEQVYSIIEKENLYR